VSFPDDTRCSRGQMITRGIGAALPSSLLSGGHKRYYCLDPTARSGGETYSSKEAVADSSAARACADVQAGWMQLAEVAYESPLSWACLFLVMLVEKEH
jgi:hypothetical protein